MAARLGRKADFSASMIRPLGAAGDRDWAVLLSGQSAALTKDTNAAELVQRLAEETARRLRAFA